MEVDGVAQIETGEDGEHIGLQGGHQQLQADQQHVYAQREDRETRALSVAIPVSAYIWR